jgi:Ca2+-binding EF-hand superfamily protein
VPRRSSKSTHIKDPRAANIKLAHKIFASIDTKDTGKVDQDNLAAYFKEYSDSSVKIILKEMDFNLDGIITHEEWLAYWEYVRLAGYD